MGEVKTLKAEKQTLEDSVKSLTEKNTALGTALNTANDQIKKAKASLKEMEWIRAEANALRRKLAELIDKPYTCPELEKKYEEISVDTAKYFNSYGLRGKIKRPNTDGNSSGGEVLQPPAPTGIQGDSAKAN